MANRKERTLVILKPDSIQRALSGEIIQRLERTGLKLVAVKMLRADEKQIFKHYGKDDQWYRTKGEKRIQLIKDAGGKVKKGRPVIEYGRDIIRGSVRYLRSSPVVAMVWQGNRAVDVVKKLVGTTDPTASDVGTIRGDYQYDSYSLSDAEERGIRNLVHCSDQPSEAEREIKIWFTPSELHDYVHVHEAILEDVNLDGIKE